MSFHGAYLCNLILCQIAANDKGVSPEHKETNIPIKIMSGGGEVVQFITLSLPTQVEVELGCDN